jgi:hypothetical protein
VQQRQASTTGWGRRALWVLLASCLLTMEFLQAKGLVRTSAPLVASGPAADNPEVYDSIQQARDSIGQTVNFEAVVPPQCYTKTDGEANPCWTCHTSPIASNYLVDWSLQEEYAFSDFALTNHWTNLFADRAAVIASISDEVALGYIRTDNYTPLRQALQARQDYPGWVPDLDFEIGFDPEGFANDGSHWRAIRYKPFLGTFWPTNGSTDDVQIRLPAIFRTDAEGRPSRAVYKIINPK